MSMCQNTTFHYQNHTEMESGISTRDTHFPLSDSLKLEPTTQDVSTIRGSECVHNQGIRVCPQSGDQGVSTIRGSGCVHNQGITVCPQSGAKTSHDSAYIQD